VKFLITMVVISAEENDDNKSLVYIKRRKTPMWLADILDSDLTIEILRAVLRLSKSRFKSSYEKNSEFR